MMSEQRRFRVSILGATPDNTNMGVNVLAAGSVKCVLGCFPDAEVSFFDYGKEASVHTLRVDGREIVLPKINIRFSKKIYLPNNIAFLLALALSMMCLPLISLRRWILGKNRWLRHFDDCDLVLSVAGGDSFSDIYGLRRLIYVSSPQILALLMKKKLVLMPQTIGPFKGAVAKRVACFILQRANRVYARDDHSLADGIRLGARPDRCAFCYDVGFVLDAVPPPPSDDLHTPGLGETPLVGLNVSGLLFHGGYTHSNMFGLKADYRKLVYDMIDFLIRQKGASVVLVPHVFGRLANSESDWVVCNQIWQELGSGYGRRLTVLRGTHDQSELKYLIGQCDFFIGSRMHACIAAVSQGIPAVSIAYSKKFIGVMESVGIGFAVADARSLGEQEILEVVEKSFDRRDEIRHGLLKTMLQVKSTVLTLLKSCAPSNAQPSLVH